MPDVTPQMLANSIMGKIYDILTNGDATAPKSENSFFSWCTPGIACAPEDFEFITQGFTGVVKKADVDIMREATATTATPAAGDGAEAATPPPALTDAQLEQLRASDTTRLYQQAEAFARLVDFIPDVTRINNDQFARFAVMNDEGSLSEIYERTLKFSQVMQSSLTDDEKKKIERFRTLLTAETEKEDLISGEKVKVSGPSPLVQLYNEKMTAYENAALEYNSHRIDALAADNSKAVQYWAINANILRNKVKAAMADWVTTGHKTDYESIAAFIEQVEGRDLTLLKQAYLDDLAKAKLTGLASGSDFYNTSLTPGSFATASGWTKFTFSHSDYTKHQDSHLSASGWDVHAGGGFFGIGAHGSASETNSSESYNGTFEANNFSLSFEINSVSIVRPWLHSSYLMSKTWRFDEHNVDVKGELLSDGGSPPKGLLPAFPTAIIFVRNLALNFGKNTGFSSFLSKAKSSSQEAGASYGFGPFSFGGGGSHFSKNKDTSKDSGFSHTDEGMTIPGLQIIGFKCHVLPKKTPDPAPGIKDWV
jgi:hypothetical protein